MNTLVIRTRLKKYLLNNLLTFHLYFAIYHTDVFDSTLKLATPSNCGLLRKNIIHVLWAALILVLRFIDLSKCISCNCYNFTLQEYQLQWLLIRTARILIFFFINLSKIIYIHFGFINPHNIIQSNNYICAVLLNCFCIVSHFSQNSNTIHGIYTFLIQVHIFAPMYRSRSGKSLKKYH